MDVLSPDICLAGSEGNLLGQVPDGGAVLEVHHSGHAAIIVVDVDGADHLLSLEVPDAEADTTDGVAAAQLHQLSAAQQEPTFKISILFLSLFFTRAADPDPAAFLKRICKKSFLKLKKTKKIAQK